MRASKQLRQTNNLSDGQTNTELKNGENRMDLWVNNWLDFDFYSATYGQNGWMGEQMVACKMIVNDGGETGKTL